MFGIAKFGAQKIWHQILLNTTAKFGTKFPDRGTRTSIRRECWLLFPLGLWLVAVKSSFLASRCLPLIPGGSWMLAVFESGPQITPLAPSAQHAVLNPLGDYGLTIAPRYCPSAAPQQDPQIDTHNVTSGA